MSDESIEIEYNKDFQELEKLLAGVKRKGAFAFSGSMEMPMPMVAVEGFGVLSFPVPAEQAKALAAVATRAPYGRGEATILDESVRKVWQLPSEKVEIRGKAWEANFQKILEQAAAGLGCGEGIAISAELYKLLVYDQGAFFLSHRDTEKAPGMFGTLVVTLPSVHQGGELIVRHGGEEKTIDLSHSGMSEVNYAAFYADCEHEVRPITAGNRVCLVYNLIQGGAKSKTLEAPDYAKQIARAAELLRKKLSGDQAPVKIAWLFEHQYSSAGFSFASLKSSDAARAAVMAAAAEQAGCAAHLAMVKIEESGPANPSYDSYPRRGYGRYRDDDEEIEDDDGDFEIIEISERSQTISEWRDLQDAPISFGDIPLSGGELIPAGALDDEDPDEQRLMEATGNEGASFERSYRRAVFVLWRHDRYLEVLLQSGVDSALPYLKKRIAEFAAKPAPEAEKEEIISLARKMIENWGARPNYRIWNPNSNPEKRSEMLLALLQLGEKSLLEDFTGRMVMQDYDGSENKALTKCAELLGPDSALEFYPQLIREHGSHLPKPCLELLEGLLSLSKKLKESEWKKVALQTARALVDKLDDIQKETGLPAWQRPEIKYPMNAAFAEQFLVAIQKIENEKLTLMAAENFAERPAIFDPVTIIIPALAALNFWNNRSFLLWEQSADFLLKRSSFPPQKPKDWRQEMKPSCNCQDCKDLTAFALNSEEQVHLFHMKQERRSHVETMVRHHDLDMSCKTDERGNPKTLVCTKNFRKYDLACAQYLKDIKAMLALLKLAEKNKVSHDFATKMLAACEIAAKWTPDIIEGCP